MRLRPARLAACLLALTLGLGFAAVEIAEPPAAVAQIHPGEYELHQGNPEGCVGWVFMSADRKHEYWAYLEGSYDWADAGNGAGNPWNLQAEYLGAACFPNFKAWKDSVLARPEAQDHVITFQDHSVTEETICN